MKLETWLLSHGIDDTPTRKAFAAKIGVSIVTLWRMRMGHNLPTLKNAQAIFKATDGTVTLNDFAASADETAAAISETS